MKRSILSFFFFISLAQFMFGQYTFSGTITDKDKTPLKGVQITLSQNDSLFSAGLSNDKGRFSLENIPKGTFLLEIFYPGFSTIEEKREINRDIDVEFLLVEEMNLALNEVVVTADQSNLATRTATGHIFRLSQKARNNGDPYRALSEIPKLIVNVATQSVQTLGGGSPLVLVDGRIINSGITTIDPKDIESVEVIDVVSARYLRMGVKNILNIKLKKKRDPYLFFQAATRHDIPLRHSFAVGYFEVGNAKHSLYGRFVPFENTYNDDSEIEQWQKDTDYFRQSVEKTRNNNRKLLGELLYKWSITDKDFLAAHIYGTKRSNKNETSGNGTLQTLDSQDFNYTSLHNNKSYVLTSSLYYQHQFAENDTLEATLAYNYNDDESKGERNEDYSNPLYDNRYIYEYKNNRESGSLNIDYSFTWNSVNSLNVGSVTDLINDHIDKVSENQPVFHHKSWKEYFYTSFSSKSSNLYYMVSAGLEGIWLKAGDANNSYLKPRFSLSGTYQFNSHNSTQFSYGLTNRSPSVGQLNPYNTSTDPLVITKGNPNLLPDQTHALRLSHTFNKRNIYFTPSVNYQLTTDIIEPHGYTENGVFVNTYKNSGSFKFFSVGGNISYNLNFKDGSANIYLGSYYYTQYFEGLTPKHHIMSDGGFSITYKKWMMAGFFNHQNIGYSPISRTKYLSPTFSSIQVNYNFTKDFYIAVALQYFIGKHGTETETQAGTYSSYQKQYMTSQTARPWVLLRYTFRKNQKSKIKLENVVKSKEEGISL